MSRTRRQRDALAPSLFPFLAVLLCTMGALVLILMLIVAAAQASARQIANESELQAEEAESQLQLASHSFLKQLTAGQLALEKKRLELQHLENHIQELLAELERLQRTAELAQADAATDEEARQSQADAISSLEKQLLEASEKLKRKLDNPKGDKPIFAIIPYDGPNGTHRRPIYLECTAAGLKIQPEGVLLKPEDLEPPYGPGNPLDAVLRTVRAQYVPANQAVTSTAYPLLVVRPSGILTYAMARAAMSGWDDQFGYELIGEELELTFPEGEPGLTSKIVRALELAKQRQAALVLAMPQKYRQFAHRDLPSSGTGGYVDGSRNGYGDWSEKGQQPFGAGVPGAAGTGDGYTATGTSGINGGPRLEEAAGVGSAAQAERWPLSTRSTVAESENTSSRTGWNGGTGSVASGSPNAIAPDDAFGSRAYGGESFFGSGRRSSEQAGLESGYAGGREGGAQGSGPFAGDQASASASGNARGGGSSSSGGSGSGGSQAMNMGGSHMSVSLDAPGGQVDSGGSTSPNSSSQLSELDPPAIGGENSFALAARASTQVASNESSAPVASRRGRGWAWSQGPPTQTPVTRSVRLQCLSDRWIVLPDSGSANDAVTIFFEDAPQLRAEKLAKLIADRVEGWGLALTGGYWKPVLDVDVAPDADWRFDQLRQLMDGSGLEIQRRQLLPR